MPEIGEEGDMSRILENMTQNLIQAISNTSPANIKKKRSHSSHLYIFSKPQLISRIVLSKKKSA